MEEFQLRYYESILTLGVSDYYLEKEMPSFISSYWMARSFALVLGGETINALFEALNDFINLLNI